MSKRTWFYVAITSAIIFVVVAITLFVGNKTEVIVMVVSAAVALFAANASGKAKIKELDLGG